MNAAVLEKEEVSITEAAPGKIGAEVRVGYYDIYQGLSRNGNAPATNLPE